MKKRMLSMLMAFCLLLSLAPAAFAVDNQSDTITLPNGEVRDIPDFDAYLEELAAQPTTLDAESLAPDENGVYHITDEDDFSKMPKSAWYSGATIMIEGNLDLTNTAISTPSEWSGYIQYFNATLVGNMANGTRPVISGIANNRSFIYAAIGGTIQGIDFDHGTNAAFISFMPANSSAASVLTLKDITVTGNITLTSSAQSNYSPFVYTGSIKGLSMENCLNKASITGPIYGSVFHGYYAYVYGTNTPVYSFVNCTNDGEVTLQYAGLFFGNSSSMETNLSKITLTISGCANTKTLRGTTGAKFLAAPVGTYGTTMNTVENALMGTGTYTGVSAVTGNNPCYGNTLTGFALTQGENSSLIIHRPTNEDSVAYYVLSIGVYTNICYSTDEGCVFDGSTSRVLITETIQKTNMSAGTHTAVLKAYGFADNALNDEEEEELGGYPVTTVGSDVYYLLDNIYSFAEGQYISTQLGDDGQPLANGTKAADIVSVSAYSSNGALLDSAVLGDAA